MFPWGDENPRTTRPYVNYALIGVNFLVFIWEMVVTRGFTNEGAIQRIFLDYGFVPSEFLDGGFDAYSSVFSSMFMHSGFQHIIGNMVFLWIFGDNVEDRFGHGKYFLVYIFWGIVASMAHLAWAMSVGGINLQIPAVGASGAISGVLGSYLVMFPKARVLTVMFFTFVRIPAFAYLLFWFFIQIFLSIGGGFGVAYLAHIGGFAIGVVFGLGYRLTGRLRTRISYMPARKYGESTSDPRQMQQRIVHPARLEGIITDKFAEILVEMPGVNERDIAINISGNIVNIDAVTEDGLRRYQGKAIVRVKIKQQPEFTHYLNGILRIRIPRA